MNSYDGVYDGGVTDGKFNGVGTFAFDNGRVYEGEFKDGKMHGFGKMTSANGTVYEGEFAEGEFCGIGELREAGGRLKYRGAFDGSMDGYGTLYYADGSRYEGFFKEGRMHGRGTVTYADGSILNGVWKNGEYRDSGVISPYAPPTPRYTAAYPAGSTFRVCFMDHCAFVIDAPSVTMIFDCYCPDELPSLSNDKPVAVFITNRRADHCNPDIFQLGKQYESVTFFVGNSSEEIIKRIEKKYDLRYAVRILGGADIKTDWGEVITFTATDWGIDRDKTDRGVAFLVKADGRTFLHTGDLAMCKPELRGKDGEVIDFDSITDENYAERLADASRKAFYNFMRPIKDYNKIDYAMIAMDSMAGNFGYSTAKAYLDELNIGLFSPMHQWDNYNYAAAFLEAFPWLAEKMIFVQTPTKIRREIRPMEFAVIPF